MDIKSILKIKGLKYWVATAVFVVVILFIDPNNLLVTMRLNRDVNTLEDSAVRLEESIKKEKNNKQSNGSIEDKERFARENYFMKRDNEVIYKRK